MSKNIHTKTYLCPVVVVEQVELEGGIAISGSKVVEATETVEESE